MDRLNDKDSVVLKKSDKNSKGKKIKVRSLH